MPRRSQEYACAHSTFSIIFRQPLSADHLLPTAIFLIIFVFWFPTPSYAQSSTATLSGTVEDQNGALIPDVSIALINIDQGSQRLVTTNSEGGFVFSLLPPGRYSVTATREGFVPVEIKDLVLNVNDQVKCRIQLKIGSIAGQTVDIVDSGVLINESPAVGTVVDRQFVAKLPLNGRSFQSLINLSPGVVTTKASVAEQGQFSINGQRPDANYFTVDGVSANISASGSFNASQSNGGSLPGLSASGGTNNLVSVDALQEFRIQTSTFAPEFGRTPGGQIQIITRSGTNEFHGTAFEYFRNDKLDANDWFANANRLKKPPLRQNDFGLVLGGPVFLPRFGEGGRQPWYNGLNKTFFFFSYEGLRLRQPLVGITDVPSLAARQSAPAQIKAFLNALPVPTGGATGNGLAEFSSSFSNPTTLDATSIRIDHTISNRLTMFGRYNNSPSETIQRAGGGTNSLNNLGLFRVATQTLTIGATFIISPDINNEIRANYSRNKAVRSLDLDSFGGAIIPAYSTLLPAPFTSADAQFQLFLASGAARNTSFVVGKTLDSVQRQVNIIDNLSLVVGSHQLKFGGDYRRLSPEIGPQKYNQVISFSGVTGAGGAVTSGTALSGRASSVRIDARDPNTLFLTNFSAYGQDTWKTTRRLTLTYGLRWDVNPPPSGKEQLFTLTGIENPSTATLAPQGTPLYKTTYGNFAPRLGAAYQLSQKQGRETIIRGGFGVFYDLGVGSLSGAAYGFPFQRSRTLPANTVVPLSATDAALPAFNASLISGPFTIADQNLKLPRVYQWNLTVEQSLGANHVFSASYVGAAGRRLLRSEQITGAGTGNPLFTSAARINITRNSGSSDYNALQLQYRSRLTHGAQALVSYTYAKSLDNASNDSTLLTPSEKINPQQDRGPSDFDARHTLTGAVIYNFPIPAAHLARAIFGHWSINTNITTRSALPVDVTHFTNLGFGSFFFRPDLVPSVPLYIADSSVAGGRRINKASFSIPTTPRQGTLGRNSLRGFPMWQVDLALHREFNFTERLNLEWRAEFFNVFNHPNFGDQNLTNGTSLLTSTAFGVSQSMLGRSLGSGGINGGFNPLYQIGGPRSIQFALKLNF